MDKYLLIFLTALLLACSSDNEEQAGGSAVADVIDYTVTIDDTSTRGIIANTTKFLTDGRQFRVWAYMDDGNGGACNTPMISDYNRNALTAVDVTYNAVRQQWRTQDSYWWPRPEYAVDFYAIYPTEYEYNSNQILTFNTTNKTLDYTAPTNPDDAVDVMYATYHGQRDGTEKPNQRKGVPLQFHHALCQVSFCGKLSDLLVSLGWTVDINSITLCNVNSKGSLVLTTGAYSIHTRQFTSLEIPADYIFTMNADRQPLTTASNNIPLTSPTVVTMLLPQTLTAWDNTNANQKMGTTAPSTSNCYLRVAMTIKDSNGNYIIGNATTDAIVYSPFDCGVTGGWKSGDQYRYNLTFTGGYDAAGNPVIQDIGITAAIMPWTTTTVDGVATH